MSTPTGPRVAVVYGHDTATLTETELTLRRIGAHPVILGDLPAGGHTIIEQLETILPTVDAVVCLLTPDDEGRKRGSKTPLQPRARENVVAEAGYAVISRRKRSVIVALGGVSIPSDLAANVRVQHETWTDATALELARSLKDMGLAVDPSLAAAATRRRKPASTIQRRKFVLRSRVLVTPQKPLTARARLIRPGPKSQSRSAYRIAVAQAIQDAAVKQSFRLPPPIKPEGEKQRTREDVQRVVDALKNTRTFQLASAQDRQTMITKAMIEMHRLLESAPVTTSGPDRGED